MTSGEYHRIFSCFDRPWDFSARSVCTVARIDMSRYFTATIMGRINYPAVFRFTVSLNDVDLNLMISLRSCRCTSFC